MSIRLRFGSLIGALLWCGMVISCSAVDPGAALEQALREGQPRPAAGASTEPRALGQTTFETVIQPTALRGADGITCREGEALISEAAVSRIRRLTPDGSLSTLAIPGELESPTHLAFDDQGTLWVTDTTGAALWKRTEDGTWTVAGPNLPNLSGLLAKGGEIYFSQCDREGSVSRLSASGGPPEKIAAGLGCPGTPGLFESMLLVPLGEKGEVWSIDPATGRRTRLMRGLWSPLAVRRLPNGQPGVVESGNGRIVGFSSLQVEAPPRPIKQLRAGINDLAICGSSTLITNAIWGSVERLRPFGGRPVTLIPGGLLLPQGATLWGNSLLIADGLSVKRLQGNELSLVAAHGITPGFTTASGIVVGNDQTVYVSAPAQGRVYQFPLRNPAVEEFSGGMDWPTSLTRLWTGEIAVAETGSGQILRITSDGLWWPMTYALVSPLALTSDRERLLVTEPEGGRIISLREQEAPSSLSSELSRPVGIAQGRGGRTFVVELGRSSLTQRRSDGGLIRLIDNLPLESSRARYPREVPIVATTEGGLWLVAPGDGRVLHVQP